jgi:hypothetical protein
MPLFSRRVFKGAIASWQGAVFGIHGQARTQDTRSHRLDEVVTRIFIE